MPVVESVMLLELHQYTYARAGGDNLHNDVIADGSTVGFVCVNSPAIELVVFMSTLFGYSALF